MQCDIYYPLQILADIMAIIEKADPELRQANAVLGGSLKQEDRVGAFVRFQMRMFDYVPGVKVGDLGRYQATRANMAGSAPGRSPRMWDV